MIESFDKTFAKGQPLSAREMNQISDKIDELIDFANNTGEDTIPDAPSDDKTYGRSNRSWVNIEDKFITETKSDEKYQPKGNYLTEVPSEYVTDIELTQELKSYAKTTDIPDVSVFATKEEIPDVSVLVEEAPIDDKQYARKNGEWSEVIDKKASEVYESFDAIQSSGETDPNKIYIDGSDMQPYVYKDGKFVKFKGDEKHFFKDCKWSIFRHGRTTQTWCKAKSIVTAVNCMKSAKVTTRKIVGDLR